MQAYLRSGTDGVSTHVVPPQPISYLKQVGREDRLGLNAIDRIASRTPNRTFFEHGTFGRRPGSDVGLLEFVRDGQNVRVNDLVVEHDRVERGVNSIVDVVCENRIGMRRLEYGEEIKQKEHTHNGGLCLVFSLCLVDPLHHTLFIVRPFPRCTLGDNVRGQLESSADVVTTRFSNDLDPFFDGEVRVDSFAKDSGNFLKVVILESSSNVQQIKVEPLLLANVECPPSTSNSVAKQGRILATTSTVERDSDDIDS